MKYNRAEYAPKVIYHCASTTVAYKKGDLKTEKMWMQEGYRIRPGAVPVRMWHNPYCNKLCDYYFREDVKKIS